MKLWFQYFYWFTIQNLGSWFLVNIASNLQYMCMVLKLQALPISKTILTIGLHLEMFYMLSNCKHEDCHFNFHNWSWLYYNLKSSTFVWFICLRYLCEIDLHVHVFTIMFKKSKMLNDQYRCTRLRVEWLLCEPNTTKYNNGGLKNDAMIGWIGVVSRHCDHLLVPVSWSACVCAYGKYDFLMLILRRLWYTNKAFDLLALLGNCNQIFTRNEITKQFCILLHVLYFKYEKCCTNFEPLFPANLTYFHHFPYTYLILSQP